MSITKTSCMDAKTLSYSLSSLLEDNSSIYRSKGYMEADEIDKDDPGNISIGSIGALHESRDLRKIYCSKFFLK